MFRRRQPTPIPLLATAAAVGLVVPAISAHLPVQVASAASRDAVAGLVSPAIVAGAVVAGTSTALATAAGQTTESGSDPAPEPAAPPLADTTTTLPPDEQPAVDQPVEPTATTTEPPAPTTSVVAEPTVGEPTVGEPIDELADEAAAQPTTSVVADPAVDQPIDEAAPQPPIAPEPADERCAPVAESITSTTTTTTTTTITPPPVDEPDCHPTTTTPVTAPAPIVEPAPATTPTTAPDPAVDSTTGTTSTPEPVDEPVGSARDGDGPAEPEPEHDVPADPAAPDEGAEPVDQPDSPATPIDTTPAELNTYDPGLRASSYDGVYAEGVPIGVALATTRWLESGNRYDAQARGSTASGAYQIIDSTWNGYGGYARAVLAPPEVQDQFAYEAFTALLKRHGNDVSTIPVSWYIGHLPQGAEWDTVPLPEAGNTLTPREYQAKWMEKFFSLLSEGAPVYLPSDTEPLIPAIAFPVLGPVEFVDDWHFERDGGARRHEGLDLLGYEGQPIRAVFDGVITAIDDDPSGIAGNGLRLTRADGLYANYFHLSNSETGPVLPGLDVGARVRAGQIIGFMGSTGNAGIPHLHFELRTAEREPMAPYPAVLEAVQREQCTVGLGPWSTEFRSPIERAEAETAALRSFADLTVEQIAGLPALAEAAAAAVEHVTIEGPDGAQWVIGTDGSVTASGQAAMIGTYQAECPRLIETIDPNGEPVMYGTDAGGLPIDDVPIGWWDVDAVEWTPDLTEDGVYVDPWELDQAELDVDHHNHTEHGDDLDPIAVRDPHADRRSRTMM